jgi:hypothetical protein
MFLDSRVDGVGFSGLPPQSHLPPERDSTMETRVYLRRQCLLSEPSKISAPAEPEIFGALAAIFLPLLIGKAIGGVSAALKKAGAEKTVKDSGRLPTYLPTIQFERSLVESGPGMRNRGAGHILRT